MSNLVAMCGFSSILMLAACASQDLNTSSAIAGHDSLSGDSVTHYDTLHSTRDLTTAAVNPSEASRLPFEPEDDFNYSRSELQTIRDIATSAVIETGYMNFVTSIKSDPIKLRFMVSGLTSHHDAEAHKIRSAIVQSVQSELGYDIANILLIDVRDGPVYTTTPIQH